MTGEGDAHVRTSRVASWTCEDAALDTRIRRRLFSSRRAMIVLCCSIPEAFGPDHVHSLDQITVVVRGRVEARLGRRLEEVPPGSSIRVPAGTAHALRAIGPGATETINVFLPAR